MEETSTSRSTTGQSGLLLGVINSLSDFIACQLMGAPTPEERNPSLAASAFIHNFEAEFGPLRPPFIEASYREAVQRAKNEFKFLVVYLHSDMHSSTSAFCRTTLTSETFVEYISDNFLIWGGNVKYSDPFRVSYIVGATTYPFLCVLANIDSTVEMVERIEGPVSVGEVLARLTNVLENQGPALVAARCAHEEREMNRLIIQEQDLAYQESLRADQEKEEKAREEERQRLEEERRVIDEERRIREEAERKANYRKNQLERKRMRLPSEPQDGESACSVVVRLPDGSRLIRRFRSSDSVRHIYDFVDISEPAGVELGSYTLVTNMPRKVLPDEDISIKEAGLDTQAILFIQINT